MGCSVSGPTDDKQGKQPRRSARRDAGRPRGQSIVDAVLDQTIAELAAHGLEALSIDRIARAATVNKTSIYRRFATKDALVVAALSRVHDDISAALVDTGSLRGDLRVMVESVSALLGTPAGLALARTAMATPVDVEVGAIARAQLGAGAAQPMQALIARAQARGQWRDNADPVVVLAMVVGALLHRRLLEGATTSPQWIDAVVDLAVAALAPAHRSS